jgi:hypothetical protein
MSMNRRTALMLAVALLAAPLMLASAASVADEMMLNGDQIKSTVSNMTVEGKMNDGMAYSEFYGADGTIKGKDYTGKWTVEGNEMCFVYGTDPKKSCYGIQKTADGIAWIEDGKSEGTGVVTQGNVRNY